MGDLQERARAALRAIVEQYSAGEAEVVRAYFQRPHTAEDHVEVLLKQMGREIQVRKWVGQAAGLAQQLERGVDRHTYLEFLRAEKEEVEHYVLLADLAEWLNAGPLPAERLLGYEVVARYNPELSDADMYNLDLPDAGRNLDVGRDLLGALGPQRGYEVMHLAEGGGGGAFVECARLTGDEFRDRLAEVMRRIVKDELRHGPDRIDGYVEQWIRSDEELETDVDWLKTFMAAHLRVRNEIWGYPLSEQRLEAIDRGDVTPLVMGVAS